MPRLGSRVRGRVLASNDRDQARVDGATDTLAAYRLVPGFDDSTRVETAKSLRGSTPDCCAHVPRCECEAAQRSFDVRLAPLRVGLALIRKAGLSNAKESLALCYAAGASDQSALGDSIERKMMPSQSASSRSSCGAERRCPRSKMAIAAANVCSLSAAAHRDDTRSMDC